MATEAQPALSRFADWVRTTDAHAARRLPMLDRAARLLADPATGGQASPDGRALASQLERWRYQILNEHACRLACEDRGLADALDLAANALAGRRPRAPRATRRAIRGPASDTPGIIDAQTCLDPAVELEQVIGQARQATLEHFTVYTDGSPAVPKRRMAMYAPLYLSSHCINHCVYCGFRYPHQILRKHLSLEEALREADVLGGRGFRHILLVAGDFPSLTTVDYYTEVIGALVARGFHPTVEIAPQAADGYARLRAGGACGVTLYQETYDETLYRRYHPRGTKASFDWRLEGLERAAEAGMTRLGLGILLGLADPRQDLAALMRHGRYLQGRFPDCALAFSLPRIREAPDAFRAPYEIDDALFVRLYCALRIAFPQAELVLSTRESPALRDQLAGICITQLSAGSSTTPGGYGDASAAEPLGRQFPVCDHRSPAEVAEQLRGEGFELVWDLSAIDPSTSADFRQGTWARR